jgi:hypothetical protein
MLRIEDMAEWYPCWIDGLRMNDVVWSGWYRSHYGYEYDSNLKGCWWSPEGTSCAEYFTMTHDEDGAAILPRTWRAGLTTQVGSRHDTGAAGKWMNFYDQATADLVYQMYKDDFNAFGYEKLLIEDQ